MGVAAHLGIDLREYDARIRTFIPSYEAILDAAAGAIGVLAPGRAARVLDLGVGTGGLSSRVLASLPRARIVGVDTDASILAVAARRLGRRLTPVVADFARPHWERTVGGDRFHAVTASFSLHHIRTKRRKAAVYAQCFDLLRAGGVLVSADCCVASSSTLRRDDHRLWRRHLEEAYTRAEAERFLRAWSREDVYFTLEEEMSMIRRAGFAADVVWRSHSFAVIAGCRKVA